MRDGFERRPCHRRRPVAGLPCALSALWFLLALTAACTAPGPPDRDGEPPSATRSPARFVGRQACVPCHADVLRSWEGSQHDRAMQPATDDTVAGDFDDATLTSGGVTTRFFRGPLPASGDSATQRDFRVRTDGPDGGTQDYRITHTFGVEPLQQYLVEMPGGRLQALSVCWDTRPAESGGQRWFHLYPGEAISPGDALHWTGVLQNWNSSCAECHSTRLQKNYRRDQDLYETSWSEIDVSCEACHGPASRHVDWAREAAAAAVPGPPGLGLDVVLRHDPPGAWTFAGDAPTARRSPPVASRSQVEACGRCHARSARIAPDDATDVDGARPLEDTHRVALLDEGLYHADGQILDEVYVYGSFIQSAMYKEGVSCTDCHDPHTARLRLAGNATCSPCHRPAAFDTPRHHFHTPGSPGASCVSCHMPARDYMIVDPRHDHGFRVPRPDLTVSVGLPNACDACHAERGAPWAAQAVASWYPGGRSGRPHPAEAIQAGRTWQVDGGARLSALIRDEEAPAILRATALSLLRRYPASIGAPLVADALRDVDPRVRRSAAELLAALDPDQRLRLGTPLLVDPIRSVRLEAVRALADSAVEPRSTALLAGITEYRRAQEFHADRAEGQMNLAWLSLLEGDAAGAERAYRRALSIAPTFSPAAINLADLFREQGQDLLGERLLREALTRSEDDAALHHALGLLLARQQRYDAAVDALGRAADLGRGTPRYAYVLAVALNSTGRADEALRTLEQAHARYPADADTLLALATIHRDLGDADAAARWARKLLEIVPDHAAARQLLDPAASRPAR